MEKPKPTRELTLAQALVYKKRLSAELSRISAQITQLNVQITGQEFNAPNDEIKFIQHDNITPVEPLMNNYLTLSQAMTQLKLSMWRASEPIREKLLTMAEHKSFISGVLNHILVSPRNSPVVVNNMGLKTHYFIYLTREDAEGKKKELEKEIDRLQSEVDAFNHTTKITITDTGLL